jgi:hypothetical protein
VKLKDDWWVCSCGGYYYNKWIRKHFIIDSYENGLVEFLKMVSEGTIFGYIG